MQIEYISVSRGRTYIQCPWKYHLIYEKGIKDEQDHFDFGTIIHESLEEWYKGECKDDLLEIFDRVWQQNKLTDISYYKDGVVMLKNYLLNPKNFRADVLRDEEGKPVLEKEFRIEIAPGIFVVGVIDRIDEIDDNTIEVIDYKTSRNPHTKEELIEDLQLSVYDVAVRELFPQFREVELSLNFLRFDKMTTTRNAEDREHVKQYLINLYHQIKNDDNPQPKLNTYCSTCAGRHLCPAYQEVIKDTDVESILVIDDEEAKANAWKELELVKNKMKILERRKEELEESFKSSIKELNKNLIIDDQEIYLYSRPMVQYDLNTVANILGVDRLPEVANVTKGKVDALVTAEERERLLQTAKTNYAKPALKSRKIKK